MGPIGAGGTAALSTPVQITSVANAETLFADSPVVDAARVWFRSRLSSDRELWAFGFDATTWLANTWGLTVTGTATSGGSLVFRYGDATLSITVAKDDDASATAAKINAAINAANNIPATSTVLAAVVTVTSDYVGLETQRTPISFDLYSTRGEPGVPGISVAVVSDDVGAGEPGALVTTNISGTESYDWYIHGNHGTALLDSLEDHLETRHQDHNNYARAFASIALADQAATIAVATARNDLHHTWAAQQQSPTFELSAATHTLIQVLQDLDLPEGAGGFPSQNRPFLGPAPIEPNFDAEAILQAGISPIRVSRTGAAVFVRLVTNRRTDDGAVKDLRLFGLDAPMRTRELGQRMVAENALQLDKGILGPGQLATSLIAGRQTDEALILQRYEALFTTANEDGLITTVDPTQTFDPAAVVTGIVLKFDGGTAIGWDLAVNPEIVQNVVAMTTLATLR
jgi:phage tail sheath gpL-like